MRKRLKIFFSKLLWKVFAEYEGERVFLREKKEFRDMELNGKINHIFTSDDGEITHYGTIGNPSHIQSVWYGDYGQEYLIIDHPNPIAREVYETRKIFFEEKK